MTRLEAVKNLTGIMRWHAEHADRDGQVGLAAADVAVEHEVLGPVDEFQAFQLFAAPVGGERGHAPGRIPPGSCSGGTRPV